MTLMEVPYINGYKEFEEILGKEVLITIDENTFEYKLEIKNSSKTIILKILIYSSQTIYL